jgi:hypothetical protein
MGQARGVTNQMADQNSRQRLKVFISYSRRDCSALAEELAAGLELLEFDGVLDRHDIAAAEDWEARLANLIQNADTVIFLLSPEAVKSERCAWEVRRASEFSKRLIPVVARPVRDEDVPEPLRRLNYVFFTDGSSFSRGLGQVAQALRTDLDWIREHTRLAESARRWQERGQLESLLLRDDELVAAQAWMLERRPSAPEITDLQRALINASADAQSARDNTERQRLIDFANAQTARAEALADRERTLRKLQRRTVAAGVGAGVFSLAMGGLTYWAWRAERRYREERKRVEEAEAASFAAAVRREAGRVDIEGQLVAYAASPGQEAFDGLEGEQTSPFTKRLLEELADPNASLQTALSRAGRKVVTLTKSAQRPFVSSDLNGEIFLCRKPPSRQCKAIVVAAGESAGNYHYPNVPRDGQAWTKFLERCNFEVSYLSDPKKEQVIRAFDDLSFRNPLRAPGGRGGCGVQVTTPLQAALANTCLAFVFSGGGWRVGRDLFLSVFDSFTTPTKLDRTRALDLEAIAKRMRKAAAASVLVLDTSFTDMTASR